MDTTQITHKLNLVEKTISQFLGILTLDNNEIEIEKQIQNLNLQKNIEEMINWNYCVIRMVPLLLKIIIHEKMRSHLSLLKPIIRLLGNLKPDGFISEYAFSDIVKGTPFSKEEIFEELKKKGYIENHTLSPTFKPMDENFHFNLDPRFFGLKDDILEVILSIPKDISVSNTLISLLKDQTLTALYPVIINALCEIGNPVAFPVLLKLVNNNEETARAAIVKMGLRDIEELKQLLGQGVTEDVWGNDLREKVFTSIRLVLPLLFKALTSDAYSIQEKKLICFLFSEIGVQRQSDFEIFVYMLPVLYEEEVQKCYVTMVLISGGKNSVPYLNNIFEKETCEKGSCEIHILKRLLYILGVIGPDAGETLPYLNKLIGEEGPLTGYIRETIQKITPVKETAAANKHQTNNTLPDQDDALKVLPVTHTTEIRENENETGLSHTSENQENENETGLSIDEVQKQNINTDPEDYVLF